MNLAILALACIAIVVPTISWLKFNLRHKTQQGSNSSEKPEEVLDLLLEIIRKDLKYTHVVQLLQERAQTTVPLQQLYRKYGISSRLPEPFGTLNLWIVRKIQDFRGILVMRILRRCPNLLSTHAAVWMLSVFWWWILFPFKLWVKENALNTTRPWSLLALIDYQNESMKHIISKCRERDQVAEELGWTQVLTKAGVSLKNLKHPVAALLLAHTYLEVAHEGEHTKALDQFDIPWALEHNPLRGGCWAVKPYLCTWESIQKLGNGQNIVRVLMTALKAASDPSPRDTECIVQLDTETRK